MKNKIGLIRQCILSFPKKKVWVAREMGMAFQVDDRLR